MVYVWGNSINSTASTVDNLAFDIIVVLISALGIGRSPAAVRAACVSSGSNGMPKNPPRQNSPKEAWATIPGYTAAREVADIRSYQTASE